MSGWIHCNACCLGPSGDRKLAVTSCGHIVCSQCYHKHTQAGGNRDECLICKSKCNLSPLNDKSSSEVKSLFSDIKSVAAKHLKEISKVTTFQTRQQKRLLAYYKQRNDKLEENLFKMKQEIHKLTKKLSEQSAHITKLEYSLQHQSTKASSSSQQGHTSYASGGYMAGSGGPILYGGPAPRHASSTYPSDNVEMGDRSMFRKPNAAPRLSLISPAQDGGPGGRGAFSAHAVVESNGVNLLKGAVPRGSLGQNTLANRSSRSAIVSRLPGTPLTPDSNLDWKSPLFRPSLPFRHSSSMSSLICQTP